jgi:hypothetical protein
MAKRISSPELTREYLRGWMAVLDEMRRPDWRAIYDRTSRDIAAGRGRDLEKIAQELGLDGRSRRGSRGHKPGVESGKARGKIVVRGPDD